MPIMEVTMLEGRGLEQKRAFIARVTEAAVTSLAVAPDQVRIIIREIPAEHFAVGGISKADRDRTHPETKTAASN